MNDRCPHEQMITWLHRIVIGENLCPFAKPSVDAGQFDLRVSEASDLDRAYLETLSYLDWFLQEEADIFDSAMIIFPQALQEFEVYLDCLAALEAAIEELNLEGIIQLASFHPDYLFEGEAIDDQAHWTNRSPIPAIHLLREERVSQFLDLVPHPEKIPQRNIDHFRSLSSAQLDALFLDLS